MCISYANTINVLLKYCFLISCLHYITHLEHMRYIQKSMKGLQLRLPTVLPPHRFQRGPYNLTKRADFHFTAAERAVGYI